jgi:hypothetical protein
VRRAPVRRRHHLTAFCSRPTLRRSRRRCWQGRRRYRRCWRCMLHSMRLRTTSFASFQGQGCESICPSHFQGPSRGHRTLKNFSAFPTYEPYLQLICFQGRKLLKRKENSSRASYRRLRVLFCYQTKSTSWCSNVKLLPFQHGPNIACSVVETLPSCSPWPLLYNHGSVRQSPSAFSTC